MGKYHLYTDGGCAPNPGVGGWAFILRTDEEAEVIEKGSEKNTTNNRMELTAVLSGMKKFQKTRRECDDILVICSDSQYLLNGIETWSKTWERNKWIKSDKKPVLNQDLWQEIRKVADDMEIEFFWMRGHTGHVYNERCDQMATDMIKIAGEKA